MSAVPVSSYLADFGPGGDLSAGITAVLGARGARAKAEHAAEIEAARAEGYERGRAAAAAEAERRLAEQRAEHEAAFARARTAWVGQEAAKLADRLTQGLAAIETALSEAAARVLHPFLADALRRQALDGLCAELDALLRKGGGVALEVSGPADLLEALRARLADRAEAVVFAPGEGVDVRVRAGQTVLETRLGAWLAGIGEAIR